MIARVYHAPEKYPIGNRYTIFLAGSIEQGVAKDWQTEITKALSTYNVNILNPRRLEWDSTWENTISNPVFKEQVEWELDSLNRADLVVMFLDENTKSPISLLELGLMAEAGSNIIVCCEDKFWRRGNIEVVCHKYGIYLYNNLERLIIEVKKQLDFVETIE